jgi:hypothetical protein
VKCNSPVARRSNKWPQLPWLPLLEAWPVDPCRNVYHSIQNVISITVWIAILGLCLNLDPSSTAASRHGYVLLHIHFPLPVTHVNWEGFSRMLLFFPCDIFSQHWRWHAGPLKGKELVPQEHILSNHCCHLDLCIIHIALQSKVLVIQGDVCQGFCP